MVDLYNSTVSIADAQAEVNKLLPSSIKFNYGTGPDASYTPSKPLEKPVLQPILNRIRELANLKYENGTSGNPNPVLLDNIETLQKAYRVVKGLHFQYKREENAARKQAKKDAAKAEREALNSQAKVAANKPEQDRVKAKTNKIKSDKIIAESSPNSDQLGKEISGFKSLTESTKPKTAIPNLIKLKSQNLLLQK